MHLCARRTLTAGTVAGIGADNRGVAKTAVKKMFNLATPHDKVRRKGSRMRGSGRASRACAVAAASVLAGVVAGCVLDGTLPTPLPEPTVPAITPTVQEPGDIKFLPSDEARKLGLEHFNRGDYGLAERYFKDAVEKNPRDATAWVGLAASYDRIGRFDLADRAYQSAIKLVGETTDILNDLGYSYMLRGQFATARRYMMKAYARDPNNPTISNNLQLLDLLVPPTR